MQRHLIIEVKMLKFFLLLALFSFAFAMPMTVYPADNAPNGASTTPLCRDADDNYYNLGYNFQRRDGMICNCTYIEEELKTYLQCRSSQTSSSSYPGIIFQPVYTERQTAIARDHCVYEGRVFNLNTRWSMEVNGVMMMCTCNANAYLSCSYSSSSSTQVVSRTSANSADYMCRTNIHVGEEHFPVRQAGGYYSLCVCVTPTSASCQVLTISGSPCQFPFEENGRSYSTCASSVPGRPLYCVTSRPGQRRTVSNCVTRLQEFRTFLGYTFTSGGNANGAQCSFPFTANGVIYNQCTSVNRRSPWCATTPNYERDQRYGYCQTNNGGTRISTNSQSTESIHNRVGETVTLECRFNERTSAAQPTVTWYKVLERGGRQKLYQYDGETGVATESPTAGLYRGRLRMTNPRQLVINNMRLEDSGTFECEVNYVGNTEVYGRTDVAIVDRSKTPTNLRYIYTPRLGEVQFFWINPDAEFDNIRLEYQERGGSSLARVVIPRNRNNYAMSRLRPGAEYEVRIYTVTDGVDSAPARMTFTVPQLISNLPSRTGEEIELLTSPRTTQNEIYLNWNANPFQSAQVTNWIVVYVDASTGASVNRTLSSSEESFIIRNLIPGQRYRVKLLAIVDGNQIEVATQDVETESPPLELTSLPHIDQTTPSTITVSWERPVAGDVTSYEISYRANNNPTAQWRTYSVPASSTPRTIVRNLLPGTQYDVHITPISGPRRGVYLPFLVSTMDMDSPGPSIPITQPQNLTISGVTRSTFLAQWAPPEDNLNNIRYRIRYYPTSNDENVVEDVIRRTYYRAVGLLAGLDYTFEVVTLADDTEESSPAITNATTIDEVCLVDRKWRAADEKFYKRNPNGYMQNCTCYRTDRGGRWRCDPISCQSRSGSYYTVGKTWEQEHDDGDYIEACTCTLQGSYCQYKRAIERNDQRSRNAEIGASLVLQCPHETTAPQRPIINWYKLTTTGKVPLYRYDGPTGAGTALVEAGHMYGRISMLDEVDFVINPVRAADSGTYQCSVQYPGVLARTTVQTGLTVVPSTSSRISLPSEPTTSQIRSDSIQLSWSAPVLQGVTGYRVEYRDENDIINVETVEVSDETVLLENLSPSTTYQISVIPLIDQVRGEASTISVTTESDTSSSEVPTSSAPQSPANLRFDQIDRSSIRVQWDIPFFTTPVDYYRLKYKPHGSNDTLMSVQVYTRSKTITDLEPGTAYQFRVYSVKNDVESIPTLSVVSTRPIGRLSVDAMNTREADTIGSNATLLCNFDVGLPGNSIVTWYKVAGSKKQKIATYDSALELFEEAGTVGEYSGRIEIEDPTILTISNIEPQDHGEYECNVKYSTGGGSGRTQINIIGPPHPVEFVSPPLGEEETEYQLSWNVDPAPRATQFILQVRRQGSQRQTYTTFYPSGAVRSFSFTTLLPGSTYEGSMIARNQYGQSSPTPFAFTTASSNKPEPPSSLRILNSESTQLTIEVIGPSDNTQYYKIVYYPEQPVAGVTEKVVTGRNLTDLLILRDMVPDTMYILQVSAVNENGESVTLRGRARTPPDVPEPPTGLAVNELSPRRAVIAIEGPRAHVHHYQVSYKPAGSDQPSVVVETINDQSPVTLSLEPDTQYEIEAVAVNENGVSPTLRAFLTTPKERLPPPRPIVFSAIRPRADSATLTWRGNTDNVQYYVVSYQAEGESQAMIRYTQGPEQTAIIRDLLPGTTYHVSVKAVGEAGESPLLTDSFDTEQAAPQPTGVRIVESLPDEVSFDIEGISVPGDYFIIKYYPIGNETQETQFNTANTEVTLTNLQPATRYRVTVTAVLGNDRSEPIVMEIVTNEQERLPPPRPTAFTAIRPRADSATLTWRGNTDDVQYYVVSYQAEGESQAMVRYTQGPEQTAIIRDLLPGTTYRVSVKAVGEAGESPLLTDSFDTEQAAPQPTGVRIVESLPDEVSFDIEGISVPGDYFIVKYYPIGNETQETQFNTANTEVTLTNLQPATRYRVTVIAVLGNDRSEPITTEVVTNELIPSATEAPRRIPSPSGFVVSRRGSDQAELRWSPSPRVDFYLIEYEPTFNKQQTPKSLRIPPIRTYATLPHLTPGTEYEVRVYTVEGNRQSEPASATFMSRIDSPSNLRATTGSDRLTVTWENPAGPRAATRLLYRRGNSGVWMEQLLTGGETQYIIPLRSIESQPIHIQVIAIGGNTESVPATITITPAPSEPVLLPGIYLDRVSDRRADVVFGNIGNLSPRGWTLTLIDEEGAVGSPQNINDGAESFPLSNLDSGHRYIVSLRDATGREISRNQFMTKVAKPRNVRYLEVSPNRAVLSWESPDDVITGYVVQYKPDFERNWQEISIDDVSNTQATIGDLQPETYYNVLIFARYNDTVMERPELGIPVFTDLRTPSNPETSEGDHFPNPVSDIIIFNVTDRSVKARWQTSSDLNVEMYSAILRKASNDALVRSINLRGSVVLFSNLQPGTEYTLNVYSVAGTHLSDPVTKVFSTSASSRPLQLYVTNVDDSSFKVMWQPAVPQDPLLTEYIITVQAVDSSDEPMIEVVESDVTSQRFRSLHPGTVYEVMLNPIVDGREEDAITARTTTNLPAPADLHIVNVTEHSLRVTWVQPNEEIENYFVEYRPTSTFDDYTTEVMGRTDVTLNQLQPNTEYVISVYSLYENKRSAPNVVTITTLAPQMDISPPESVEIYDDASPASGSSSFSLRWRFAPEYQHLVVVTPQGSDEPVFEETFSDTSQGVIDGLNPSTTYRVRVYAIDSNRRSRPVTFEKTTKPRIPMTMNLVKVNQSSIEFSWPDVMGAAEYVLKYRSENGDVIERVVEGQSLTLTDLQPLTTYTDFSLQTMVDGGLSEPYRYPRPVRTAASPPPTQLSVLSEPEVGPNAYIVAWEPVENYIGTYTIEYHPSDVSQTRRVTTYLGHTSFRLPSLLPGVKYIINVYPTSSVSPDSTASTELITPVPSPTSVNVQSISDISAVVEFSSPDYATVTSYEVRYYPVGRPVEMRLRRVRADEEKRVTLSGLQPDTEYRVEVLAYAGLMRSLPSSVNFATEQIEEPTPPTTIEEDEPNSVDVTLVDENTYQVQWPRFDGPVRYYKVVYTRQQGGQRKQIVIPRKITKAQISNLIPGESYDVSVVAVISNIGERTIGTYSIESAGGDSENRSVQIEWLPLNDIEFTQFRIVAVPENNPLARQLEWVRDGDESSIRLIGLYPGTRYSIHVEGYTTDGSNVTVLETTLDTEVDPPTNFRTTQVQTHTISLAWDRPTAPIDSYSLTYQLNGIGLETTFNPSPSSDDQNATLTNLSPGQNYVIRLYATSLSVGADSVPARIAARTSATQPLRFRPQQVTPNLISLAWSKPSDAITHYTVRIIDGSSGRVLGNDLHLNSDVTSHTVRQLEPDTRYRMYLTSWVGNSRFSSASRTVATENQIANVTSVSGELVDDGYFVRWRGKSRKVEGWLIVVEPDDGSEPTRTRINRLTKTYKLVNLKAGVSYTVKIYPYSGTVRGSPSVIRIPASQLRTVASTIWRMQIPQVTADSIQLIWTEPWYGTPVEEYELVYKLQSEPDSAYRLTPSQPVPGDLSTTIDNLEVGQSYSIRLKAFHSASADGADRLTLTLLANVTLPFPPPTGVHMLRHANGTASFTWQASSSPVTSYVIQYRLHSEFLNLEYVTERFPSTARSASLTSLMPGEKYEIRMFSENGERRSTAVIFRIDIPETLNGCRDSETNRVYQVGEHWISVSDGFRMNCSCTAPQRHSCDTGNWCQIDRNIYKPGDTWRNEYDNNKKEVCICEGNTGYICYPRNCQENGRWYDEGAPWRSIVDGKTCTCTCPSAITQPCRTTCRD